MEISLTFSSELSSSCARLCVVSIIFVSIHGMPRAQAKRSVTARSIILALQSLSELVRPRREVHCKGRREHVCLVRLRQVLWVNGPREILRGVERPERKRGVDEEGAGRDTESMILTRRGFRYRGRTLGTVLQQDSSVSGVLPDTYPDHQLVGCDPRRCGQEHESTSEAEPEVPHVLPELTVFIQPALWVDLLRFRIHVRISCDRPGTNTRAP